MGLRLVPRSVEVGDSRFARVMHTQIVWTVSAIGPECAAQSKCIEPGDVLVALNGESLVDDWLDYTDAIARVRCAPRPCTLRFRDPEPGAPVRDCMSAKDARQGETVSGTVASSARLKCASFCLPSSTVAVAIRPQHLPSHPCRLCKRSRAYPEPEAAGQRRFKDPLPYCEYARIGSSQRGRRAFIPFQRPGRSWPQSITVRFRTPALPRESSDGGTKSRGRSRP